MTFGTGEYKQKGYQSWCQRCPKCWANGIIEKCNECDIIILKDKIGKDFMKSKWEVLEDPSRIRVFGIIHNSENHPNIHMVEERVIK